MPPYAPVLTVTLNPAVDLDLFVGALPRGRVARADGSRRTAGGKGLNVSRELASFRIPSTAVFPLGGPDAHVFLDLLKGSRFETRPIPVRGAVRTNVTAGPPGKGYLIKINQPGPPISAKESEKILRAVGRLARGREWVVLSGSLPPGMPADTYAQIIRAAHHSEAHVAIDCEGAPLLHALDELPELVRINRRELAATLGRPLKTQSSLFDAMDELQRRGALYVVVTDGPRAAFAIGAGRSIFKVIPPKRSSARVFGAGDAMLAAMVSRLVLGACFDVAFAFAVGHAAQVAGCLSDPTPNHLP